MTIITDISLVLLSSILLSFSHPNFLFEYGFSFLSLFQYIPVFILIFRNKKYSPVYGFAFGFLSYFFLSYWLIAFNLWAALSVYFLFGIYWALTFFLSSKIISNKYLWWITGLLFFFCEFLSCRGYLGFSYGVTGYAFWNQPFLLLSAKWFGVWGLTFAVIFINILFYKLFSVIKAKTKYSYVDLIVCTVTGLFISVVVASCFIPDSLTYRKTLNVLLVQNNSDPWQDGIQQYKHEVDSLICLTEEGLKNHPETQLVVWPETAVVVDVISHYKLNINKERYELASQLFEYINSKDCQFITGGNYKNYNSAILFSPSETHEDLTMPAFQIYSKTHLVPFSEDFPFKKFLKPLYNRMLESGNVFWDKGDDVFCLQGKNFLAGTPICFEDTFSDITKKMKNNGAEIFVNLSNDSWSGNNVCQMQHLAIACFRSAENSIASVRATNSGITCYIDKGGRVVEKLAPFTADTLYCEVNLNTVE